MRLAAAVLLAATACGGSSEPQPLKPESATPAEATGSEPVGDEQAQVAAIEKAIGERGPAVYACRSRATADDLRLDGKLRLKLTLGAAAVVSKVEIVEDTVEDPVLTECLAKIWDGYSFDAVFAVGDVIELPPFEFVSEGAQYVVNAGNVEPVERGRIVTSRILTAANTGNPSAALDMIAVYDGGALDGFVKSGAEVFFTFVGGGTLEAGGKRYVYTPTGKKRSVQIGLGSAVYVSTEGGYQFRDNKDGDPTILFRFATPDAGQGKKWRTYARGKDAAEVLTIANGKASVRLYFDAGVVLGNSAYLGVFTADPGTKVPEHTHPGETEMLFVLAGEARMTVDGKPFPVGKGDAIQVPPGTLHAAEVMGKEPFQAIQVYTPSGPEQRFRPKK
ncbi:MAG: cupin domain-containing protein [Deltaproteobacteria bacterium]|nr:cupin domain-containing protein [Deltaproteobacteria bacterium]